MPSYFATRSRAYRDDTLDLMPFRARITGTEAISELFS